MTVPGLGEVRMTLCVRVALISLFAVGMGGCGQAEQVAEEKDAVQQEAPSAVAVHDADTFVEPSENQEGEQVTEGLSANENASVDQEEQFTLVTKSDWEGMKCHKSQAKDEPTYFNKCTFPNANLQQVYDVLKKYRPDMRRELPATDIKYGDFDDPPEVIYTYKNPKHLHVLLEWEGGAIEVEIIEKDNETQSVTTHTHY